MKIYIDVRLVISTKFNQWAKDNNSKFKRGFEGYGINNTFRTYLLVENEEDATFFALNWAKYIYEVVH